MAGKGWPTILLALVTCLLGQFPPFSGVESAAADLGVIPNRYIVETSSQNILQHLRERGGLRRSFYDARRKRDVPFAVNKEYNVQGIFVGGVVEINDGEDVNSLSEADGVISVTPVHLFPATEPVSLKILTDKSDPTTPDPLSTHILTGVDKAHARGFTGEGIAIGIIDTGVDYAHPALGGGFGPGFKFAGGYDFVGDDYNGTNTPVPDPDPLDRCNGHGTRVAGIIGSNPGNEYNIEGVACNATLYAYRIFGCTGGTDTSIVIEGLLRGYGDNMDILTLSLGSPYGFSEGPAAVVASRIVKAGKVVTISAGNDGSRGPWYTSAPATGIDVISVGSVDNTVEPVQNATIHVNGKEAAPISYFEATPLTNVTTPFEIYATSTNTSSTDDACEPLPDDTPDLTGKVVLIHRGTCTFVVKCQNAAKFGATLFLIYNNDQPFVPVDVGDFNAALIQADAGVFLVKNFAQGNNVTITFTNDQEELPNLVTGGIMSSYSSLGPSYELDFKPSISAPGGSILTTFPNDTFGIASGTSISAPFVAGSSALILQGRGKTKEVALAMRDIFETTASPIPSNLTDAGPPQTLIWSGAGLIQVDRALDTKTLVSPGHLILNDTAHFQPIQNFTVTNTGTEAVTYTLAHVPAGTIYTYNGSQAVLPPFELTRDYATIEFSRTELTISPGESNTITAKFTPPAIDANGYPAYSGHIEIKSSSETLRVSYLGVLGSVHELQLMDRSYIPQNGTLPFIELPDGSTQNTAANYTFTGDDFPLLVYRLLYGSPQLTIDLVTADSKECSNSVVVGNIVQDTRSPRTPTGGFSNITIHKVFSNMTTIPDGQYRLLFKTLKIFGEPDNPGDLETYLSPVIGKVSNPPPETGP